MSAFTNYIYYGPEFEIRASNGLSRYAKAQKSIRDTDFFNERHLLELANNNIGQEYDVEDIELQDRDVAARQTKNRLWVVP